MANQIIDSVYIIDVGSADVAFPLPSKARIQGVAFWGADTTSRVDFAFANTANVWLRMDNETQFENLKYIYLGGVNFT